MNNTFSIAIKTGIFSYASLGFYRGYQEFNYILREKNKKNENMQIITKHKYLYSGICGTLNALYYVNPLLIFFTVPKEYFRIKTYLTHGLNPTNEREYYKNGFLSVDID